MDRFLDEQESPAALDRVGFPAVSAADCEQVTGQQQVLGFPADDSKPCSQIHADGAPVVLHEDDEDVKPRVSNGEHLTVATTQKVETLSTSELLVGEASVCGTADDVTAKSDADTRSDLHYADDTLRSVDSRINTASNLSNRGKSASVQSSLCHVADDEMPTNSQSEEMVTEVDTNDSDSAAAAAVSENEKSSTDVDAVVLESSEETSSSLSATDVTACDQRGFEDDKSVSDSHYLHDSDSHPTSVSISLSASTVLREPPAVIGCAAAAVDEVRPDDVELLLAAVDSATSVTGSLYSNVDPLTAALEFSSSSIELLSNKTETDAASEQAGSVADYSVPTSSQQTDSQPSESALLLHSSNSSLLPVSCSSLLTTTSCVPPHGSGVLKPDDGSVSDSAPLSTTSDVTQDAGKDMEMILDEPPVAVIPTVTSDLLAASRDSSLPDESVGGSKPLVAVDVTSTDEENATVELGDVHCPNENELMSLNSNQSAESRLQPNSVAASVSGPDASNTQADGTDALHIVSVKTNSDSVSCSVTCADVTLSDKLADPPHSLDKAEQSESVDSRSLLTVSPDSDGATSAS